MAFGQPRAGWMAQRGSPGLQGAGDRMAPGKPARVNRRRVRALSPLAPCTRSRPHAVGRAKARTTQRSASTISMWNGCCRFSFKKQPEGRLAREEMSVEVCAHRGIVVDVALVSARHGGRQFPLRPYRPYHLQGTKRRRFTSELSRWPTALHRRPAPRAPSETERAGRRASG
jgi:hypothetical protein